ncbi:MAG: PLP-dependent aminotransferase family protein [Gammaproteobacteria bacterium]|nr:PLP-dependent aminotransferase family protein [Gammaproteobacteria bacterium]
MLQLALDPSGPLNRSVYAALRAAILERRIISGRKLPSSRALAADLGVSRNTVLYAYEQLAAEGYVETRVGSGTYVVDSLLVGSVLVQRGSGRRGEGRRRLSALGVRLARDASLRRELGNPRREALPHEFRFEGAGHERETLNVWARLLGRRARSLSRAPTGYQPPGGSPELREALAGYLSRARGLTCRPEQIVVTQGSQQGIDLCLRLLVDAGDRVVVEEPHYAGYGSCLDACGASVSYVPVDAAGIQVELVAQLQRAKVACVTPSHQFPTGGVMPLSRRLRLLDWARQHGTVILEDDYDGEFRHEGRPIECLQSLDQDEQVIYLGTASRMLFPALRIGWAVAPVDLVDAFQRLKAIAARDTSSLEQLVLADFINGGWLERHVRRARKRYAVRRAAFLEAIRGELGTRAELVGVTAGTHALLRLPELSASRFADFSHACQQRGVGIYSAARCYARPPECVELLAGYASLAEREIGVGVRKLREALDSLGKG